MGRESQKGCDVLSVAAVLFQIGAGGALELARLLLRQWVSGWIGDRVEEWTAGVDVLFILFALLCILLGVGGEGHEECAVIWVAAVLCQIVAGGALELAGLLLKRLVSALIGARVKERAVGIDFVMHPVRTFLNSVGGFCTLELLRPVLGRLLAAWFGNWAGELIVGIKVALHFICAVVHPVGHFSFSCSSGLPCQKGWYGARDPTGRMDWARSAGIYCAWRGGSCC